MSAGARSLQGGRRQPLPAARACGNSHRMRR